MAAEFNDEQRVMIGILRAMGRDDAEAIVNDERLLSTYFGSAMLPALQNVARLLADIVASDIPWARLTDLIEREA